MPGQQPQFLAFTPSLPPVSDEGLWLSRNAARSRLAWANSWAGEEIARLTAKFQPTPMLERAVTASVAHRSVALVGVAGAGKSTLVAALMRPEVSEGAIPTSFALAIAFLSSGLLTSDLARMLVDQLDRAVPGFAAARDDYLRADGGRAAAARRAPARRARPAPPRPAPEGGRGPDPGRRPGPGAVRGRGFDPRGFGRAGRRTGSRSRATDLHRAPRHRRAWRLPRTAGRQS